MTFDEYQGALAHPACVPEPLTIVQLQDLLNNTYGGNEVLLQAEFAKGRRGNNFTFFAEDFRRLLRSAYEGISGIFLCRRDKGRRRKDLQRM